MSRKTELTEEIRKLRDELGEIEEAERRPVLEAQIGKCYRFRNSYGGNRPSWWLYCRVVSSDGFALRVFQFQNDGQGRLSLERTKYHAGGFDGYEPITPGQFNAEWLKFRVAVAASARKARRKGASK